MTDQIPADKVREILEEWERIKEHADWDDMDTLVKDIRSLLPAPAGPPRPTLADMTREERDECRWMQADVGQQRRAVIAAPGRGGEIAALLDRQGNIIYEAHDTVTPRPDLPRMTWPGDTGQEADQ